MSETQLFDVLVIGAGLYGIQSARTYLEIHPDAKLAILEAGRSIGGVWSKDRVYSPFWTQNSVSIAEFSDVPLELKADDLYHGLFQATHITRYIEEYVRSHQYAGTTLEERIIFNSRVKVVKKADGIWLVELESGPKTLRALKIIDASGITSEPELPDSLKLQAFKGIQMHMKDLAKSDLYSKANCSRIAVIGGGKSSADASYSAAQAGKTVYWIIRKSGNGPCYFAPSPPSGPFKGSDEPVLTRLMYFILCSQFVEDTFVTRLLNRTAIGRSIIRFLWSTIESGAKQKANYDRPDPKGNGFKNLEPDTPLYWANDGAGVEQTPDFFDTIAERVKVVREDIREIGEDAVVLADGSRIAVDTIIYSTGWRQTPGHYDLQTAAALGLPVPLGPAAAVVDRDKWASLDAAADAAVLARFPILAHPPPYFKKEPTFTPHRLYRIIAPVHDPSIVFLGRVGLINSFRVAEAQALWAVAALDGRIHGAVATAEEMERDVAATVAWCRRRYLNKGQLGNWLMWDCVAYSDRLLADLGLTSHLGKEGLMSPCRAASLRGLIDEYRKKYPSSRPS